ncbi:uncharacterized protein LOC135160337 [Diachasmimorpha longicaudata]|uniref:uncharacterized protein LOC135160337 n=1 Tax=Diachasmimorpha longicaudata TaxID=58733 RepID=UPI0030B869F3
MHVVKLLLIICCLWTNVLAGRRCTTIMQAGSEPYEFKIVDGNPILEGLDKTTTSWYKTINWKQAIDNNLKLTYKRDELRDNSWWHSKSQGTADLCNFLISGEAGSWAHMVREALGLAEGCGVEGEVKVNGGYFSGGFCRDVNLDTKDGWNSKQRLLLDVEDDSGTKLLTGVVDLI